MSKKTPYKAEVTSVKYLTAGKKKIKVTVKKLKKGKKYQFRVRSYVKVDGQKYYGKWSKVKTSKKVK